MQVLSRILMMILAFSYSTEVSGQVREHKFNLNGSPTVTIFSSGSVEYLVLDGDTQDKSDDTLVVISNDVDGVNISGYSYRIISTKIMDKNLVFELALPDEGSFTITFYSGEIKKVKHSYQDGSSEFSGNIKY